MKIKGVSLLVGILIVVFSILSSLLIYFWLYSLQANNTIKILIPILFFLMSILGLWLLVNLIRLLSLNRKGIVGYKLRAKITFYFLTSTVGFIVVFCGLMFYLIFLIENTFIEQERKVADNLLENYSEMISVNKRLYEAELLNAKASDPDSFNIRFQIRKGGIVAVSRIEKPIMLLLSNSIPELSVFLTNKQDKVFFIEELTNLAVVKQSGLLCARISPRNLSRSVYALNQDRDKLAHLRALKKLIFPVSLFSVLLLSIPILVGAFYVSLYIAKNITKTIEEIAKGTKTLAQGDLNYRVQVQSHDEIQDLAENFNLMADKLVQANKQIKRIERMEAWQEMGRRLAHEVKNPLTPIKLSTERLLYAYEYKQAEFGEILTKTTSTIISEAKRLENLVNEFSRFARLPYMKLEKRDVIRMLHQVTEFFQGAYPADDIQTSFPFDTFTLVFDENQLKQVVINLINNALDASIEKTKRWVMISAEKTEDTFVIVVKDHGTGIPEDVQDKIFEPYFTTKPMGSGIGLAIAERIVMEHNGGFWFETGKDGTSFFVSLPLEREEEK